MTAELVERLRKADKITGNEPRPLVNHLVKRMLAIGSRLAPVDRTRLVVRRFAFASVVLAVAFHRQLLQIGWKSLEILLIRQNRHGLQRQRSRHTKSPSSPMSAGKF